MRESKELVYVYISNEKIATTPEHPFYVVKKGWVESLQLRAGDILLLQNGKYVVVEKIQHEILENSVTVYNFEVEDFHTYYVGLNGVLVHNECKPIGHIKGNAPRSNQRQKKQFNDIAKEYNLTQDEKRRLHDSISGLGYGRDEIIDELLYLFPDKE